MKTIPTFLLLLLVAFLTPLKGEDHSSESVDVVVYGATPAGIAAALAVAEGGRDVLLIEPTSRIGGMTTHGLSHSDFHSFEAINGPFLHFSQRVLKYYETTYGKDSEQVRDCWQGTHGEPSVNLLIFQEMLAEKTSIRVLTEHRLVAATVEDQSINGLRFSRPRAAPVTITAKMVIDASYEGDLLAAAGVPYRVGREAKSEYNESLAPEKADDELQGYNFRLCMTQDPKNRVPVPVPANYDREDYAALIPLVNAGKFRSAFGYPGSPFVLKAHLPALPNGKHDINDVSKGLVRLSMPGRNRAYPEGDLSIRRRIEQEHLDWQLGLIHFVQTDLALPEAFRKEAATWGLCRDEFADSDHIPPQLYVREARRMVGLRVYTEADTEYAKNDARARLHSDSIAVGEYSHNCHGTGHEGPMIGGKHTGEFYKGVAPYQIPYGVIVPKTIRNLIVPTACSASHVGFCAIRLEPIWMSLGGAAGHAADMALNANVPVQQVDVEALQARIWSSGGATIHVSDVPPGHPDFTAVQWWAGLGGLHGLEPAPGKPGARGRHIISQYFDAFPGHAANLDKPLDEELRRRWEALVKRHHLTVPTDSKSRVDWIRNASRYRPPPPDQSWSLDSTDSTELRVHGNVSAAEGVKGSSLIFDGNGLLKVKDSERLTDGGVGFTLTAWVNPYRLSGGQQMIAAKNRYSLGDRQWSVMIDQDNRFRLYVYQGSWVTADSSAQPNPGHWHLIGVVMRPDRAELWVNGKMTGAVELTKPIAQTNAPLTFGGVEGDGGIRQSFVGALDEFCLFEKPLDARQMAAAFKRVAATHKIPERPKPLALWTGPALQQTSEAEVLEGVQFHVIKKFERKVDGYGFLHGVALAWHKGKLYASFGHNKGSENTLTEEGRYCVSEDGGKTWSKVQTIDVGIEEDDLAVSHGVFLSRGETLWAFLGSFHGFRKRVHTRAYTLNEETGYWQAEGTVVGDGFWPMTEPVRMDDGNWIMPGFIVGQGNPAAVAISAGDDLKTWKTVIVPRASGVRNMWGESSVLVDGSQVTNIARYGGKALALAASSSDYGRTWTPSAESNLPMAASKPCSGVLSNGQRYLICSTTADGGNRRSPLTIVVSKPGGNTFSKVFVIRHAVFEDGPGESHPGAALSYPYAVEYRGKLYVGYSNNGQRQGNNNSAELAVIPIEKLAVE